MNALEALATRRSVRAFEKRPVSPELIERVVEAATWAPAPHHTRPWRFINLSSHGARERLARAMGARWRRDLRRDGAPEAKIAALLERSRRQQLEAPALLLACVSPEGRRAWSDARRRRSEQAMWLQSMGASLQALMLAAHALGLATFWISAPLFCQSTVVRALGLDPAWEPQALIALGYASATYKPRDRPPLDSALLTEH